MSILFSLCAEMEIEEVKAIRMPLIGQNMAIERNIYMNQDLGKTYRDQQKKSRVFFERENIICSPKWKVLEQFMARI